MKTRIKNRSILAALTGCLGFVLAGQVTAQTFEPVYNFTAVRPNNLPNPITGLKSGTNIDGAVPDAGLIISGNTLYGTATSGGSSSNGTVFAMKTDGTGFTNLHNFTSLSAPSYAGGINSDGSFPYAALILSNNILYGTAEYGGSAGYGVVFAVNTDGTGFTNLHSFNPGEGSWPLGALVLSGNVLYGTTSSGSIDGAGTVFAVNTDSTGFTNLHRFTAASDGASPWAGLVISGNTLYGTTTSGGTSSNGTVFAVNTDGTGFTNLHSFTATPNDINMDGANPQAGLILLGNLLYGTAPSGGTAGNGTVFAINTNGTGFTNLHNFTAVSGPFPSMNSDGAMPFSGLLLSGNILYGTAVSGGAEGRGTVFAVSTNGIVFTNLHSFTTIPPPQYANVGGAAPSAGLILSGNTLYGTASIGGTSGNGTVFSLSFALPQLTVMPSGTNVVLMWPTTFAGFDYSGFNLQSTAELNSPAIWSAVFPPPVVVNGQNTVTNSSSGTVMFYRLSQQQ